MRTTTLRELVSNVADSEIIDCALAFDSTVTEEELLPIIQGVRTVKPTYAYPDLKTEVAVRDGRISASNLFFGSVSDIAVRKTCIPDDAGVTDVQIAAAIIATMANNMSNFEDQNDFFWTDMTNLQKAKIIR